MVYQRGCANCSAPAEEGSTLCRDCPAAIDIGIRHKEAEIKNLKYQLKLNQKILRHIFREYQELQKLKAVDIVA